MASRYPILCMNSGSSSLKFALYELGARKDKRLAEGAVERVGLEGGQLWLRQEGKEKRAWQRDCPDHKAALESGMDALEQSNLPSPQAVGHRVVHGGAAHVAPEKVDDALLSALRQLIPFAPLHLPSAIQVMEMVATRFPDLPQVACYDTAFHRRMPEVAQRFPLPSRCWDEGIRRYGFHGLSYESIVDELGPAALGRVIIAHLGNGASMAAVKAGEPLDTTMGFTPTGGFMMGTRSGDLDPGILVHLMKEKAYGADRIDQLVNQESGLLGVSGLSSDMRTLLETHESLPGARLAVEMFCYQTRKYIGALTAVLGGLDTLVFTGGIGERGAQVRQEICSGLEYLGIQIEPEQNRVHADTISTPGSTCQVRVISTNEDLMIARHTRRVCFA